MQQSYLPVPHRITPDLTTICCSALINLKLLCAAAAAVVLLLSTEGDKALPAAWQPNLQLVRQVGKNAERQAAAGYSAPHFLLLSRRWAAPPPVAEPN